MITILSAIGLFLLALVLPAEAQAAANLSAGSLVGLLIWLIVIALVFYLLWWLIGYVGLPQPFDKVARVVVALVAVIILINFLLGLAGSPMFTVGR